MFHLLLLILLFAATQTITNVADLEREIEQLREELSKEWTARQASARQTEEARKELHDILETFATERRTLQQQLQRLRVTSEQQAQQLQQVYWKTDRGTIMLQNQ